MERSTALMPKVAANTVTTENKLADDLSYFYADPLGFVMYAYPWDTDPAIQMVELEEPWSLRFDSISL